MGCSYQHVGKIKEGGLEIERYLIHYFSGTGNTYHMVKTIEKQLKDIGCKVDLTDVNKFTNINGYNMHIFCFPVYGFGTPSIMLKYISKLEFPSGCKAAIICTSAGFEGQALNHCKLLLNKKGVQVFLTDMVAYTYNWTQFFNPKNKEIEKEIFKKAELSIIKIANKIANTEMSFKKINIVVLSLSWIVFILFINFARRLLGKLFIADDSCIGCERCKNVCPSKVIKMYKRRPVWNFNCQSCQRCINICPQKSIQVSIGKLVILFGSQLIPIPILVSINQTIYRLPLLLDIILYFLMCIIGIYIAGILIFSIERINPLRRILQINYTKKYRRNIAEDFEVK